MEDRILNIIELIEDAIETEDWKLVSEAKKELNFIYEELESPYGLDGFDDDEY
jgi:hypothetical protein